MFDEPNIDEEERILSLYTEGKWKDITDLSFTTTFNAERNRFCWVLPTTDDLHWICQIIKELKLSALVSIGCGCGLFEWLLQQYSDLDVLGIELDESWWCSKYSPPLFLNNIIFLQEEAAQCFSVAENYCLLFCYFNNAPAFSNYLKNYRGNLVFAIGPAEGVERTTNPLPLDPRFGEYGWKLYDKRQLGRSKDLIAAYIK